MLRVARSLPCVQPSSLAASSQLVTPYPLAWKMTLEPSCPAPHLKCESCKNGHLTLTLSPHTPGPESVLESSRLEFFSLCENKWGCLPALPQVLSRNCSETKCFLVIFEVSIHPTVFTARTVLSRHGDTWRAWHQKEHTLWASLSYTEKKIQLHPVCLLCHLPCFGKLWDLQR